MSKPADLVQGTLDLLILKTIALEPMHGWAIAQRIRQMSDDVLRVGQSALYPRAAQARATGLGHLRMANVGHQPPGEVLRAHPGGT